MLGCVLGRVNEVAKTPVMFGFGECRGQFFGFLGFGTGAGTSLHMISGNPTSRELTAHIGEPIFTQIEVVPSCASDLCIANRREDCRIPANTV